MHRDHRRSGSGVTPLTFSPSLADVEFLGSTPTHRASWASPSVFSTMKRGLLPFVMFHLASLTPSGCRSKSSADEHGWDGTFSTDCRWRIQIWHPWMLHSAHHPTQVQPDMESTPGAGFCPESLQPFLCCWAGLDT